MGDATRAQKGAQRWPVLSEGLSGSREGVCELTVGKSAWGTQGGGEEVLLFREGDAREQGGGWGQLHQVLTSALPLGLRDLG